MPEGWAWCRLTNVAITELGKTLDAKKNKGESYDYLCALNVKWYTFDFTTLKQIRLEEKEKERYLVRKGDLLICEGGDVGRSAIWESDNPIYYQNALHRVRFYQNINQYFFLHVLNYYKNIGLIDDVSGGVTIKHFTQNSMQKLLFPLPPLAEQERIVSVIKNIFSQIDTLDQNKSDLQTAINKTKSKILDLAIHGKLVPQDPNDEPAEELLKRISTSDNRPYKKFEEDEVPFIIPFNWKWERLAKISSIISKGTTPRGGKNAYCIEGINYLRVENISADGTINLEDINHISENEHLTFLKRSILQENDVIISIAGTLGKIGIIRKCDLPMNTNQAIAFVRISNLSIINLKYLRYVLESVELQRLLLSQTKVTSIPNLTLEIINNCPIPLPPIQEQNRIVSKIEELFSDLDSISSNLE